MTDSGTKVDLPQSKKEPKNELVARPYQVEMVEVAKKEDTILFLPTGSGKTFIAMMLITHMSDDLQQLYTEGGKRSVFLVNTVPLVVQQKEFLEHHMPLSIGAFSGDMNVDFWDKSKWQEQLDKYQVLVMTAQILLNMLMHGYVNLSQLNLLIFDECHHAVHDHAMRQIMQTFEHTNRKSWPRILGLTATLLNGTCRPDRVEEELLTLETTYVSKIATCEDMTLVEKFSTSPTEQLVKYIDSPVESSVRDKGLEMIGTLYEMVNSIVLDPAVPPSPVLGAVVLEQKKTERRKLVNTLKDAEMHIKTMGLYGGSRACLAHTIQLERLRRRSDDQRTYLVYTTIISTLTAVRKLFEDEMRAYDDLQQIFVYSSNKLLVLYDLLRRNMPDTPTEEDKELVNNYPQVEKRRKFCSIVFVQRRYTAKILASILKSLRDKDPEYSAMKPDFVVGYNSNPFNQTREMHLERKWNDECLRRFCSGTTNLLVASAVLEEGIDIPQCNLVIKYDVPKHYRSYVQSKGRARQKESKYFIMYPQEDAKFKGAYENYRQIELKLQKILVGMQREGPTEADVIDELFLQIPPYDTGTAIVSLASACALVNRYCSILPQDKFTTLQPIWFFIKEQERITVFLQLPMNSPLKDVIKGEPFRNIKMAKRSAALETCKALHGTGLLNDHLLPVMPKDLEDPELFPLWEEENDSAEQATQANKTSRPGTKKRKRLYACQHPEHLCAGRPVAGENLYLHVVKMVPNYKYPEDNRRRVFYNLLKSTETFAFLCSKKFPKLCQFPIYMNVGEVQVTLQSNESVLQISVEEEQLLENFNTLIFAQVLKLMKQFIVVDKNNLENAFFMVPVIPDKSGKHIIDWDVVRAHQDLPDVIQPTEEELQQLHVTKDTYQHALVTPWYRALIPEQVYVVTEVCHEMSPESIFPSEDYPSYAEYFRRKYNLVILNKQQPLLEVKVISNKINCLRPRTTTAKGLTSRRKQEDFEENLVPELCVRYSFPAVYWLKATALPTIIHRIFYLLLAEEFRRTVALDFGIGDMSFPNEDQWLPVQYDKTTEVEETVTPKIASSDSAPKVNSKHPQKKTPWGNEKEPLDIDRHMTEVTLIEVIGFDDFISKPLDGFENQDVNSYPAPQQFLIPSCPIKDIAVLKQTPQDSGPQLCDILRALTTSASNDIIDMERLETLGDSFLKFSVSLFLFLYYPADNEGKLTYLKGKIVGNRNLFYCGKHRKLGNIIKVHDFAPASDWIPPSMCIPRELQQIIRMAEMSPNVLYELSIPYEEQMAGKISPATSRIIQQKLLEWEGEAGIHTSMENFVSVQTVSDKSIADCVEAIIGAYLQANGIRAAIQIVTWFKILVPEKVTAEWMFDKPAPSARIGSADVNMHLKCVKQLEDTIHYTFRDKYFLLQALSHPSYQENRTTECYQRLEFLGDAILDFLITCHIFETCGDLSPGKLTDLRSALVNNVTFASLIVRYGLHKFLLFGSTKLLDAVERFVRRQEENGHIVDEQILMLMEEEDCHMAEAVEVPKALGDLFEALAGAIYLDSGKDLNEVWRVFYPMMKQEIELFSVDIPVNAVRRLYEVCSVPPKFGKAAHLEEEGVTLVTVSVLCDGRYRSFHGFGKTKSKAKCAAAKMALNPINLDPMSMSAVQSHANAEKYKSCAKTTTATCSISSFVLSASNIIHN